MKKIKRELGQGVQLKIEKLEESEGYHSDSYYLHIADTNYGLKWFPSMKQLKKLHSILEKFIAENE